MPAPTDNLLRARFIFKIPRPFTHQQSPTQSIAVLKPQCLHDPQTIQKHQLSATQYPQREDPSRKILSSRLQFHQNPKSAHKPRPPPHPPPRSLCLLWYSIPFICIHTSVRRCVNFETLRSRSGSTGGSALSSSVRLISQRCRWLSALQRSFVISSSFNLVSQSILLGHSCTRDISSLCKSDDTREVFR